MPALWAQQQSGYSRKQICFSFCGSKHDVAAENGTPYEFELYLK